jgi:hypothetical protein
MICTHSFMEIKDVRIYFVVSLSFFVCDCVNHDFSQNMRHAISKLSAFVCWIKSRELHMDNIPQWHQEIVDIFFMFEKELPMIFMELQVHVLINLPNEVELAGVLSFCLMLLREVHEKIEGGWLIKGKIGDLFGRGVHSIRVIILF